jgi:hypothetical protein
MHPEIMRELVAQRSRDLQERAQRAMIARTVRAIRRGSHRDDEFVVPEVPDFVDGTFRTAGDEAIGRVPAARRAA